VNGFWIGYIFGRRVDLKQRKISTKLGGRGHRLGELVDDCLDWFEREDIFCRKLSKINAIYFIVKGSWIGEEKATGKVYMEIWIKDGRELI
jgi:hypothetical protein